MTAGMSTELQPILEINSSVSTLLCVLWGPQVSLSFCQVQEASVFSTPGFGVEEGFPGGPVVKNSPANA